MTEPQKPGRFMSANGPIVEIGGQYAEDGETRHLILETEFPAAEEEMFVRALKGLLADPAWKVKRFETFGVAS